MRLIWIVFQTFLKTYSISAKRKKNITAEDHFMWYSQTSGMNTLMIKASTHQTFMMLQYGLIAGKCFLMIQLKKMYCECLLMSLTSPWKLLKTVSVLLQKS